MTPLPTEVGLPRTVRLPPGPLPPIPPPQALVHAARADGQVHDLAARRVRVLLSGTRGVERVEGDGIPLAGALGIQGSTGANLLVGPRSARRECFSPAGGLLETMQLPEALPGILLQWTPAGAPPSRGGRLRLTASLLPPAAVPATGTAQVRFHQAPGLLWVARGDTGVLLSIPGVETAPDLRLRDGEVLVEWDLPPGSAEAPPTLLLQAAPPHGVWPALTALAGVAAHHRRGEMASLGDGEPGVRLETGVEEMDSGVLWARAWTRDRLLTVPWAPPGVHAPPAPSPVAGRGSPGTGHLEGPPLPGGAADWLIPGSEAAWLLMGSAASGDWEAGRGALSALAWDSPRVALVSALALARWAAWTGEARPLVEHEARLAALFGPSGRLAGVAPEAVAEVRRAVAAAGEAGQATGTAAPVLTDPATPAPPTPAGGVRRLPVVAGGVAHARPPLLFLSGREDVPVDLRLREALEVREGLGAVADAPHLLGTGMGPVVLQGLVAGVLGASPDAGYGRLTLSPLLPPGWTRFRVEGIRTGEGALGLDYRRDGGLVRWTLRPQEGSVPLMLVFEPWQPVTGIRALRVDGAPAELDVTEEGRWSRVRIQIPADGTRVVELEGTTEGRP